MLRQIFFLTILLLSDKIDYRLLPNELQLCTLKQILSVIICCLHQPDLITSALPRDKLQHNFNQDTFDNLENTFENVVFNSVTILFRLHYVVTFIFTYWDKTKWPPLSRRHLQMHFLEWKMYKFRLRFHWRLFPVVVQLTIYKHWHLKS